MHATMTVESTGGVKAWLNDGLITSAKEPGSHAIHIGVIREGRNSVDWFRFEQLAIRAKKPKRLANAHGLEENQTCIACPYLLTSTT